MRWLFLSLLIGCLGFVVLTIWSVSIPWHSITFGLSRTPAPEPVALFTGDVFLGRAVERAFLSDVTATPFSDVHDLFSQYPIKVINFEAAIPAVHQPTPDFGFQFSVAESAVARLLPDITHASLANNHSYDFGQAGFLHSQTALQAAGITAFGNPRGVASSTVIIDYNDTRIALIGLNDVGVRLDQAAVTKVVQSAQEMADWVVVTIHWGDEYVTEPNDRQREVATWLAAAGTNLVIGHHSHVVQTIERVGDTLVFYSLGNTVFDQYFSQAVQEGLLLGLQLTNETSGHVVLYPVSSLATPHQPQLISDSERDVWLSELAALSNQSLKAEITAGYIEL